jgi:pimeloyl-ACP methyl ester carboxylesterase
MVLTASIIAAPPAAHAAAEPGAGTGAGTGIETGTRTPAVPVLSWQACAGGFECATAAVPLDYDDPGGHTIDIALIRHPAADPAHRIGSVFFNPGGPGGSGTTALPLFYTMFPQQVRDRFDVVSFDPRGVGLSTAVQCYDSLAEEQQAFAGVPVAFPVGAEQTQTWIRQYAAFGQACDARQPELAPHLSTANVAKDMDLLRQAVGDPRLNFIGVSYGTYLGATYANLFPRNVRALVLDGNIDPVAAATGRGDEARRLAVTLRFHQDQGMAATLRAFTNLCGAADTTACAFSAGSPAATRDKYMTLLQRLRAHPVTVGAQTFTYDVVVGLTGEILYATRPIPGVPGWPGLAAFLQQLWNATAAPPGASDPRATTSTSALPAPVVSAPGNGLDPMRAFRSPRAAVPATATPAPQTAPQTAPAARADEAYTGPEQQFAITCSDTPNPRDPGGYQAQAAFAFNRSRDFGLWRTWAIEPCATWPVMDADRYTGPWNRKTANPVLLIGNSQGDPATPYEDAQSTSAELGDARLLTLDSFGHTAQGGLSRCIDDAVDRYLIDGTLPPEGKVCEPDFGPFDPIPDSVAKREKARNAALLRPVGRPAGD